jgi:hypothetical protein
MRAIQQATDQGFTLYEVSDGSMSNESLSFGWVLGTNTGQRLAWNNGPGYGTNTSHRSEGWAKLSAAKFMYHLSVFTATPFPRDTRLVSFADNRGLISILQKRSRYSVSYPNTCLKPDWDLTEEIYRTYLSTNIPDFSFEWVKGHQDSTRPATPLSVEARFNIFADQLASDFMTANSRNRPLSPLK